MIVFNSIPSNLLVPGAYTETNSGRAAANTLAAIPKVVLLMGQMLSSGVATAGVPKRMLADNDGDVQFGVGSELAEKVRVFKARNRFAEIWAMGMADNGSGVAATGTIVFAGPATAAGTLNVYIAPYWVGSTLRGKYQIPVTSGMTATQIGTALVAAIAADPFRQVTGVNTAGSVATTARHAGLIGNSIIMMHSYFDQEALPAGVTCTITPMASGATNPLASTAIAGMGDRHFTHLVHPWTDATSMTSIETELNRRWGGTVQKECQAFTGMNGTLSATVTYSTGRNSQFQCFLPVGLSPTPFWVAAAELAAIDAGMDSLAQPLRTQQLNCLLAPVAGSEFAFDARQQLLASGCTTYTVAVDGSCQVERLVTMNQLDALGNASAIYRDRMVLGVLFGIRYDWRTYIGTKYPNFCIADDGSVYAPGVPVITPTTIKNEFEGRARTIWQYEQGWIENADQFAGDIQLEKTAEGIDLIGVPDLINQLHVMRTRFDFLR